jgi:hypothetical protein
MPETGAILKAPAAGRDQVRVRRPKATAFLHVGVLAWAIELAADAVRDLWDIFYFLVGACPVSLRGLLRRLWRRSLCGLLYCFCLCL